MIKTLPDPIKGTDSVSGAINNLISHHSMLLNVDYRSGIGLGVITGHTPFRAVGRRSGLSIATAGDDIWNGVATSLVYPNQTTGEQCTLVSTSANDTAAGSGAQQVDVHYLDNTGAEQVETVTMNGVTPVNTVATNIRFIQYIHTQRVATLGNVAAGNITIYSTATPANIFNMITAGGNISLNSARMVPVSKNFYLDYIKADATDNKPVSVRLRATCDYEGVLTTNIFIFNEVFELQDSSSYMSLSLPRKMPAFTIIKGTAYSISAGGSASISYGGWLE